MRANTIPCGPLIDRLEDKISDGKVLALVEAFLGQDILDGLRRWTPTMGTPQGAVLTPRTQEVTFSLNVW
ncbi:MAG: hypothetical protein ACREV1_07220 [Gammaproteobacteria bacterium]